MQQDLLLLIGLFVVMHLLFVVAVLLALLPPLLRMTGTALWRWFTRYAVRQNDKRRLAQIRAIGQQARHDMQQMYEEYVRIIPTVRKETNYESKKAAKSFGFTAPDAGNPQLWQHEPRSLHGQ